MEVEPEAKCFEIVLTLSPPLKMEDGKGKIEDVRERGRNGLIISPLEVVGEDTDNGYEGHRQRL